MFGTKNPAQRQPLGFPALPPLGTASAWVPTGGGSAAVQARNELACTAESAVRAHLYLQHIRKMLKEHIPGETNSRAGIKMGILGVYLQPVPQQITWCQILDLFFPFATAYLTCLFPSGPQMFKKAEEASQ